MRIAHSLASYSQARQGGCGKHGGVSQASGSGSVARAGGVGGAGQPGVGRGGAWALPQDLALQLLLLMRRPHREERPLVQLVRRQWLLALLLNLVQREVGVVCQQLEAVLQAVVLDGKDHLGQVPAGAHVVHADGLKRVLHCHGHLDEADEGEGGGGGQADGKREGAGLLRHPRVVAAKHGPDEDDVHAREAADALRGAVVLDVHHLLHVLQQQRVVLVDARRLVGGQPAVLERLAQAREKLHLDVHAAAPLPPLVLKLQEAVVLAHRKVQVARREAAQGDVAMQVAQHLHQHRLHCVQVPLRQLVRVQPVPVREVEPEAEALDARHLGQAALPAAPRLRQEKRDREHERKRHKLPVQLGGHAAAVVQRVECGEAHRGGHGEEGQPGSVREGDEHHKVRGGVQ
mmetsp:Transcript_20844/g.53424  ORF Transcript_20844/g.53424 Transcript_20844/m.53424 type:complete len:403 (-) Transcript_20844:86-1294(-)